MSQPLWATPYVLELALLGRLSLEGLGREALGSTYTGIALSRRKQGFESPRERQ